MNINEEDWDQEVMQATGLVLVDFFAPWCGPCRALTPLLERLVASNGDKFKLLKLNTDDSVGIATQYQIASLPTMLFFKDGTVVKTLIGLQSEAAIQKVIDEFAST